MRRTEECTISPNLWMVPVPGILLEGGSLFVFHDRPARPARRRLSLLAAVLVLAVAACGGAVDEGASGGPDGGVEEEPAAAGSTASPTTTASPSTTAEMEEEPTTTTQAAARLGWGEAAVVDGRPVTFDEAAELAPSTGDVVEPALFAEVLTLEITKRVLESALQRDRGIVVTESEIEAEVEEILLLEGQTEEELLASADMTAAYLRALVALQLLQEKFLSALAAEASDPTEEELAARYEAMLPSIASACSAHILLESEAEADDALDRALAGEDFGALAAELSTGPSGPNGGDLGCGPPAQFVPEFAAALLDAEVGAPYGPVESDFGWHVILVSERTVPELDEVRDTLADDPEADFQSWIDWALETLAAADVQVKPEYGVWTAEPGQPPFVAPPS